MRFYVYLCFYFSILGCNQSNTIPTQSTKKNIVPFANYLKVYLHDNFTEVQIISPTSNKIEKKFALIPHKKTITLSKEYEIIHTPIRNLVALSSNQIGMLNELNQIYKVKGVSNKKYIHNKTVLKLIKRKKINEFGSVEEINPEKTNQLKCDVICYSGFGTPPPNERKFKLLHTACIPNYDWNEATPMGKLAWIYLYGYLTGKEKEAISYVRNVNHKYNALRLTSQKNKNGKTILSGALIGDSWYLPAGKSYNATLLKDAGANYVEQFSTGHGSVKISLEKCLQKHKNAAIWINPGSSSLRQLSSQNKHYEKFNAFKNKSVYCYTHNANFFWENSTLLPHRLLQDLILLSHENDPKDSELFFYKKLTQ